MEKKIDLRLRKTYQSLHAAFTELMEEKHFEELTVGELCDRAAIRRTTFYKHFADKYDYFSFYIREMTSSLQHHLPQDTPSLSAAVVHVCREMLDFLHVHSRMVSNIRGSSMFPLLLDILLDQFTRDITELLRRLHPEDIREPGKLEGIAAFYAGGLLRRGSGGLLLPAHPGEFRRGRGHVPEAGGAGDEADSGRMTFPAETG